MFELLTSQIARIIFIIGAIKFIISIAKSVKVKKENQFLKKELEYYKETAICLQEEVNELKSEVLQLESENEILKYNNDIMSNNIDFYGNINAQYEANGIEIELDFNICSYNESNKDFLTTDRVKELYEVITNDLSDELQAILKFHSVKFCLRDMESIQLEMGINYIGYYSSMKKEIHIGLSTVENCLKTLYHEIGHFIDDVISDDGSYYYSDLDEDTKELFEFDAYELRDYARTNVQEFIAVAFEEYLYDEEALNHIPLTRNLIENYLMKLQKDYYWLFTDDSIDYNNDYYLDDDYDCISEFVEVGC